MLKLEGRTFGTKIMFWGLFHPWPHHWTNMDKKCLTYLPALPQAQSGCLRLESWRKGPEAGQYGPLPEHSTPQCTPSFLLQNLLKTFLSSPWIPQKAPSWRIMALNKITTPGGGRVKSMYLVSILLTFLPHSVLVPWEWAGNSRTLPVPREARQKRAEKWSGHLIV